MKVISIRSQILEVADRWRKQYPREKKGSKWYKIQQELDALDKTVATANDVEKIIGNNSWVGYSYCDECDECFNTVVELGEEPDYESATARICGECLKKAMALFEEAE